jgi:regulator of replication initiation timing
MWEKVFEIFKRFFTISDELKRLQADSKLHGEQIRELIDNQTRLYYEFQLQKERNAHEREKETLRLENQQLRERLELLERLLPSATTDKKPDEK